MATWDPGLGSRSTNQTLLFSNGNLTATMSTPLVDNTELGFCGRATVAILPNSNVYWEVTQQNISVNESACGIIGTQVVPPFPNQNSESLIGQNGGVAYAPNSNIFIQNTLVAQFATYTNSDVIGLACIPLLTLFWVRVNGGGWNNDILANQNPATATGGVNYSGFNVSGSIFPALQVYQSTSFSPNTPTPGSPSTNTLNPGPSFAFAMPAGFTTLDNQASIGNPFGKMVM